MTVFCAEHMYETTCGLWNIEHGSFGRTRTGYFNAICLRWSGKCRSYEEGKGELK
jgi:hypothetical protein